MTSFKEAQKSYIKARAKVNAASLAARKAAALQLLAESQKGSSSKPITAQQRKRIDLKIKSTRASLTLAKGEQAGAWSEFQNHSDPRIGINNLPDTDPLLLFPLRLETRFVAAAGGGSGRELLVRVYPDSCLVDSFTPELTPSELANAKVYWTEMWRANGSRALQQAAWSMLASRHGTGRARWIVSAFQPANQTAQPSRNDGSVALIITTQKPLDDDTAAALAQYWEMFWRAANEADQIDEANAFLVAKLGEAEAARLIANYVPVNLADAVPEGFAGPMPMSVHTLVFPPDPPLRATSWNAAAVADPMPERFVLVLDHKGSRREVLGEQLRYPLHVSFDPTGTGSAGPSAVGSSLQFSGETAWMVDFDEALKAGMAFRVALSTSESQTGFDRLYVVGVALTLDAATGGKHLADVVRNRLCNSTGFEILAQGTPTNNAEDRDSGFSRSDDPDIVFDAVHGSGLYQPVLDDNEKSDGQVLAEALHLPHDLVTRIINADGGDQKLARATNTALWPATMGYFMTEMMSPVFDLATIGKTREHVLSHVSGRGGVPAIRIGRQPYGILPVTALSRASWARMGSKHKKHDAFVSQLNSVLNALDGRWMNFANDVKHVGSAGDPQDNLINVLGLHAGSAEFHFRYAESFAQFANFWRIGGVNKSAFGLTGQISDAVEALLKELGYSGASLPRLAKILFHGRHGILDGGLVASQPHGPNFETEHKDYIEWLVEKSQKSIEDIRRQAGIPNGKVPHAMLYILLRHATLLAFATSAADLHLRLPGVGESEWRALLREEPMPHVRRVRPSTLKSESKWEVLKRIDANITGGRQVSVADYLSTHLGSIPETKQLEEHLQALKVMATASREAVELAFREHIDIASYRFDAWQLSIPHVQLSRMKRKGIYLGAYGWLNDIRPKQGALQAEQRPEEELKLLDPDNKLPPLRRDPENGGLIQAPSLNQAVTGAILRNAYMSADTEAEKAAVGVNLSSERVRNALYMLDGMRGGQSINALLGYAFERGLKDSSVQTQMFLQQLRFMFPISDGKLLDTESDGSEEGAVAARNVVDGLKLIEQMRTSGTATYPFGLIANPAWSTPDAAQSAAINEQAQRLKDLHDAVGDVILAESVHQSVMGNFERAASSLDAFSKGELPPEPDIVRTPTSGISITHRVTLHLDPDSQASATPRSSAAPALNNWLLTVLPDFTTVSCRVLWLDPTTGLSHTMDISLADLGLQPIDLVLDWKHSEHEGFAGLEELVSEFLIAQAPATLRPDSTITVRFMETGSGTFHMFEIGALVSNLSRLLQKARPLRASDLMVETAATVSANQNAVVATTGLASAKTALGALQQNLDTLAADALAAMADATTTHAAALQSVDQLVGRVAKLFEQTRLFAFPQSSPGRYRDLARRSFQDLLLLGQKLSDQCAQRLSACDGVLGTLPVGDDTLRMEALRLAENHLETIIHADAVDAATLELQVIVARNALAARITEIDNLRNAHGTSIRALYSALANLLSAPAYRPSGLSLDSVAKAVGGLVAEIQAASASLASIAKNRVNAATTFLAEAQAQSSGHLHVEAATKAAQAMFGEEFIVLPRFVLDSATALGLSQSLSDSQSGSLFSFLENTKKIPLPVDEWLHGIARVREPMQHLEETVLYAEALGANAPALTALQLPYRPQDSWLGLEFPETYDINETKLLYTAHFAVQPAANRRFCGLMLDEWTEVIPGSRLESGMDSKSVHTQTTGVAFHFDRPNAEAPQSLLLVTPASWDGEWNWQDVVGALDWTWDMMRKRAVEPVLIKDEALSQLLPATISAVAARDVTITAALAANINVQQFAKE